MTSSRKPFYGVPDHSSPSGSSFAIPCRVTLEENPLSSFSLQEVSVTEFDGGAAATPSDSVLFQVMALPGPTPAADLYAYLLGALSDFRSGKTFSPTSAALSMPPKCRHDWQPQGWPERIQAQGVLIESTYRDGARDLADKVFRKWKDALAKDFPHDGFVFVMRKHVKSHTSLSGNAVDVGVVIPLSSSLLPRQWNKVTFDISELPSPLCHRWEWGEEWDLPSTLEAVVGHAHQKSLMSIWDDLLAPAKARQLGQALELAWEGSPSVTAKPRL